MFGFAGMDACPEKYEQVEDETECGLISEVLRLPHNSAANESVSQVPGAIAALRRLNTGGSNAVCNSDAWAAVAGMPRVDLMNQVRIFTPKFRFDASSGASLVCKKASHQILMPRSCCDLVNKRLFTAWPYCPLFLPTLAARLSYCYVFVHP